MNDAGRLVSQVFDLYCMGQSWNQVFDTVNDHEGRIFQEI